jgi:hypothetical protein
MTKEHKKILEELYNRVFCKGHVLSHVFEDLIVPHLNCESQDEIDLRAWLKWYENYQGCPSSEDAFLAGCVHARKELENA